MTACQHTVRTWLSNCHKMPDFIARDVWDPVCLKIQNMIVKKTCVLLLHYITSPYLYMLYDIAFKCPLWTLVVWGEWINKKYNNKLEIRSVERGICPIVTSTINERAVPIIMAGCMAHEREGYISTSSLKSDVTIVFLDPYFL